MNKLSRSDSLYGPLIVKFCVVGIGLKLVIISDGMQQMWSPRGRLFPQGRLRRTHFEVLGLAIAIEGQVLHLGLEASSPQKLTCPRLRDSTILCSAEILLENATNFVEN